MPKKKKNKRNKPQTSPGLKKVANDWKFAKKLAKKLKLDGSSIKEIGTPELDAMLDPESALFLGGYEPEERQMLQLVSDKVKSSKEETPEQKRAKQLTEEAYLKAGVRPEDIQGALDDSKSLIGEVGTRSDEMAQAIEDMKINASKIRENSPRLNAALDRMEANLTGLDAPEMQALRDKSAREIEGRKQQAERSLNNAIARSGARGGAALAAMSQLDRSALKESMAAESDLLIENAKIKEGRLKDYTDTLTGLELSADQNEIGALRGVADTIGQSDESLTASKLQANRDYTGFLSNATASEAEAKRAAMEFAVSTGLKIGEDKTAKEQKATDDFLSTTGTLSQQKKQNLMEGVKTDIAVQGENSKIQGSKEAASLAGPAGILSQDIANKSADAQMEAVRSSGRGGSSSDNGDDSGGDQSKVVESAIDDVINELRGKDKSSPKQTKNAALPMEEDEMIAEAKRRLKRK